MPTTKYIVNNLTGQTISGNQILPPYKKFVGLLTSSPQTLNSGTLTIGETYEIMNYSPNSVVETLTAPNNGTGYPDGINTYNTTGGSGSGLTIDAEFVTGTLVSYSINVAGVGYLENESVFLVGGDNNQEFYIQSIFKDDFTTVAQLISGTINQTGCIFRCIGETPDIWSYGTELQSYGVPLESNGTLNVLENSLGVNLSFSSSTVGTYTTMTDGLLFSGKTYWSIGNWANFGTTGLTTIINEPSSELSVLTLVLGIFSLSNGLLNNTPIEIRVYN